jgi:hypothetical protein
VTPWFPFVRSDQFSVTICITKRNAIVRMTKACPRVRMSTEPTTAAKIPATTADAGTNQNGERPSNTFSTSSAVVYAPIPRNALCPSET